MTRIKRALFVGLVVGLVVAACKSGEGERCQVNEDCETHLVCNKAKNTCQTTTGGDLDAAVPPQIDAAIDAPVDTP